MRSDLDTMLLPFFPEASGGTEFSTEIAGTRVRLHVTDATQQIATPVDRKILNLLAARIGDTIRTGGTPSRRVLVGVRDMIDALASAGECGGSDYGRITERLERLAATRVVVETPLSEAISRRRQFNWIDGFEQDVLQTPGGKRLLRLKITLSEEAFRWITRHEGFDVPQDEFQALTASRSSVWRIYEICLALLLRAGGEPVRIDLDELRRRVPISSDLKVFKARPLKAALTAIASDLQMSRAMAARLERRTAEGWRPLGPRERAPLHELAVCVRRGADPLPEITRLLPDGDPARIAGDLFEHGGLGLSGGPVTRRRRTGSATGDKGTGDEAM